MRKSFFTIIIALLATVNLSAQSYDSLWKQAFEAKDKGLPRTAIPLLRQIEDKAEAEGQYGHLMAALAMELGQQQEIADDSLSVAVSRLMVKQKDIAEKDGVANVILRMALSRIRQQLRDSELKNKLVEYTPDIDSLLHSVDAAEYVKAHSDSKYAPLSSSSVDSKYFNNDLLHVIGLETNQYEVLKDYYKSMGNEEATAILDHKIFLNNYRLSPKEQYDYIQSQIERWGKWEGMTPLYEHLNHITHPTYFAHIENGLCCTEDTVKILFENIRNIRNFSVRLNRLKCAGNDITDDPSDAKYYSKLKKLFIKKEARSYDKQLAPHEEYEQFGDTLMLGQLPVGVYLLEVSTENKSIDICKAIIQVSDLRVISMGLPNENVRYHVVNALNGAPVPGAKLHIQRIGNADKEFVVETDENGEYVCSPKTFGNEVYATTDNDNASSFKRLYGRYAFYGQKSTKSITEIFTDRSIYRPGQTMKIAAVAYTISNGTETKVAPNKEVKLTVSNKGKEVYSKMLKTDEFGTISAEVELPKDGGNGLYWIIVDGTNKQVRVEEYVRPTFDVTIDKPEVAYQNGDTISVKGTAKAYSGMSIGGAKVIYRVERGGFMWWRSDVSHETLLNDTVTTEVDGTFQMRVPVIAPESDKHKWVPYFYNISVKATVTDIAGESHSAELSLPLSNRKAFLSCTMSDNICMDSLNVYTINRHNPAGETIDGEVAVTIDGKTIGTIEANKQVALPTDLSSGKHVIEAICLGDTVRKEFVAFRYTDKYPVVNTHDWWAKSHSSFPADGGSVAIQYGFSDHKGYAFYALCSGNEVLEKGYDIIDSALVTRHISYKPEYGDGVTFTVVWVRNGILYTHSAGLRRALPDNKLNIEWGTFRNKVTPGSNEEWTLRITKPDGTPAKAQLMATLYDKSLDALTPHRWNIDDRRLLNIPSLSWNMARPEQTFFGGSAFFDNTGKILSFSTFNFEPYTYLNARRIYRPEKLYGMQNGVKNLASGASDMKVRGSKAMAKQNVAMEEAVMIGYAPAADAATADIEEAASDVEMRSDMSETAAFFPAVMTDDSGVASLKFTLPQSVTTWKFLGLAHDKDMSFGTVTGECVAQKELMVQPRVPRFMRESDKGTIAASVANLSNKDMTVSVGLQLLDAATEKPLSRTIFNKVEVKASETASTEFTLPALSSSSDVIVRITAQSVDQKGKPSGFSDGEQHLMPVLPAKELVTNTLPLVISEPGTLNISIKDILPADVAEGDMKVDYTDSPAWLLVKALPYVKERVDDNAISLAAALYTNSVASHIVSNNPDCSSLYDKADLDYRARDIVNRLSELQDGNGAWSWWKGMHGSRYMTMEVTKMLRRLNSMTGEKSITSPLLSRADKYLDKEVAADIKHMKETIKKGGKPYITLWHIDYLYSQSLAGRKQNVDFLLPLLLDKDITSSADMATKAKIAVVLALNGKQKEAQEFIESIVQHTVYRKDVGRYFDSFRANYSWQDYRIPTQVAAIEAISLVSGSSNDNVRDMRRWLLSSKRTQSWDTPLNAVNAIYAFFCGDASALKPGTPAKLTLNGKPLATKTSDDTYSASAESKVDGKSALAIKKTTDTESWAAVSVSFTQKQENIAAAASGLSVKREVILDQKGHKAKVVITVIADRDYDYVTITDNRAACLEPVQQLSGYKNGAYTVQHDTSTSYCYETFRKGTHRIETDYYITRKGIYTAGTVTAVCTYAPEFSGRSTTEKLKITE